MRDVLNAEDSKTFVLLTEQIYRNIRLKEEEKNRRREEHDTLVRPLSTHLMFLSSIFTKNNDDDDDEYSYIIIGDSVTKPTWVWSKPCATHVEIYFFHSRPSATNL